MNFRSLDDVVLEVTEDSSETDTEAILPPSSHTYKTLQKRVKEIEDEQLILSEKLAKIGKI